MALMETFVVRQMYFNMAMQLVLVYTISLKINIATFKTIQMHVALNNILHRIVFS